MRYFAKPGDLSEQSTSRIPTSGKRGIRIIAIPVGFVMTDVSIEVGHSMQNIYYHILFGLVLALISPEIGHAQVSKIDTLRLSLPEVEVVAKSQVLEHAFKSHRVQIVSSSDFEETNSQDLGLILQNHSGAFIKRYGPGLSSFSFRGLSSSQSVLALDGIPLSSPQLGSFDLSIIPSLALETVEIAYGGASSYSGSNGMSGMVNLTTIPQSQNSSYMVKSSMGQYGELNSAVSMTHWLTSKTWLKLSGEFKKDESDYGVLDRNLLNPVRVEQRGWDSQSQMALLGLGHMIGQHSLTLNWWGLDAERGLGFAGGENRGARQWDRGHRLWISDDFGYGFGNFSAKYLYQNDQLRYARPFPYQPDESDVIDDTGTSKRWRSELTWQSRWEVPLKLGTSFYYSHAKADHPSLDENPTQENYGGSLRSQWVSTIGQINAAFRLDRHEQGIKNTTQFLPSVGFKSTLESISVKANLSRVFRTPTLNDLYWRPGGNQALIPESGIASDLGFVYLLNWGDWFMTSETTAFLQNVKNQIVWQDEGTFWSPQNIGRVRSHGLEWSIGGSKEKGIFRNYRIFATWTRASDQTNEELASYGKQLRYTPKFQIKANARLQKNKWSASMNLLGSSRRYITSDESQYLDPYLLLGGRLGYQYQTSNVNGEIHLSLENALDRDYEIISSYGMPPRVFRIEILIKKKK